MINLFNLIPVWQLDGGRGVRALSRPQRWAAAAALGATWVLTREGMLILLTIAAVAQAFAPGPKDTEGDTETLGFWAQQMFGFARNHYDRLGHFAQGFVPAIVAREVLVRRSPLRPGKWLFFLVTCVCLAVSACYELVEWWAAVLGGSAADAFLGTQGDPWDTQWDMFLALIGAITGQVLLARVQDREIERVASSV